MLHAVLTWGAVHPPETFTYGVSSVAAGHVLFAQLAFSRRACGRRLDLQASMPEFIEFSFVA